MIELSVMGLSHCMKIDASQQKYLLQIARDSVSHGILQGVALPVDAPQLPPALKAVRASFVTLKKNSELRGCVGMIEPVRELARDISENAFAAAFRDPRFSPVTEPEMHVLQINISILSPMQPIDYRDEAELLQILEPGIDGVLLDDGQHRATFLPKVWENLPDRSNFLRELKLKAGLAADYWSEKIKVFRYYTENFSE